jgi:hypothetical protein
VVEYDSHGKFYEESKRGNMILEYGENVQEDMFWLVSLNSCRGILV